MGRAIVGAPVGFAAPPSAAIERAAVSPTAGQLAQADQSLGADRLGGASNRGGNGPSGEDYRTLRDALRRLAGVRLALHCYNAETGRADPLWDHDTHLLEASRPRRTPEGPDRPAIPPC